MIMERKDAREKKHWKIPMYRNKMDTAGLTVQLCSQQPHKNFML
jgi:hypothetical protein